MKMNKERYNKIINEVYKNYCESFKNQSILDDYSFDTDPMRMEMFVDKIKTNKEFSEKWGLQIKERELSLEEKAKWLQDNKGYDLLVGNLEHDHIREVVEEESPTRAISLTYNNKTTEIFYLN